VSTPTGPCGGWPHPGCRVRGAADSPPQPLAPGPARPLHAPWRPAHCPPPPPRAAGSDLSNNHLHGRIPDTFGGLKALQTLNLGSNKLTGPLPPGLTSGALAQLEMLNVSSNQLSGPLPPFKRMASLVTLALDGNQFVGALPPGLAAALPKLGVLSIHTNRLLSGCLPPEWKGKVVFMEPGGAMVEALTPAALRGTAITGWC
jgi:hypothetical protein